MPLLDASDYLPPRGRRNPHVQTIWASKLRRVPRVNFERERIETPDGDFFDCDWVRVASRRLLVLCHGLGGSTQSPYIRAFAAHAARAGWAVAALNFRGCSGETNRLLRSYHSGDTGDLAGFLAREAATGRWSAIAAAGFSLGGNVVLKYLGDHPNALPPAVVAAVAFSTPCDLAACAERMAEPDNRLYMWRFIRLLSVNIARKNRMFPGRLPPARSFRRMRRFHDFDDAYTAPVHGFADAQDYWRRCSSLPVLSAITLPALLLTSRDDPFLAPACIPVDVAQGSRHFHLAATDHGGHVGWVTPVPPDTPWWHERRALAFLAGHAASASA